MIETVVWTLRSKLIDVAHLLGLLTGAGTYWR